MHHHDDPHAVRSLQNTEAAGPVAGRVVWDPVWSLWAGGMTAAAVVLAPLTFSLGAVAAFLLITGACLLLGWSVGYHRRMIHRSFDCPRWVEVVLIWFGAATGLGGPLGVLLQHDLRDWGQRRPDCHPFLRHGAPTGRDYLWNLHGRLILDRPPTFAPEQARDRYIVWLQRTWMLQQLPIAGLLWLAGGWGFVVWGVCVRIAVSSTGLVRRPPRPHHRPAELDRHHLGRAGPRRPLGRRSHLRRGLAQQPPRLARLRPHRPRPRPVRRRLPLHPGPEATGAGLEHPHAGNHGGARVSGGGGVNGRLDLPGQSAWLAATSLAAFVTASCMALLYAAGMMPYGWVFLPAGAVAFVVSLAVSWPVWGLALVIIGLPTWRLSSRLGWLSSTRTILIGALTPVLCVAVGGVAALALGISAGTVLPLLLVLLPTCPGGAAAGWLLWRRANGLHLADADLQQVYDRS